MIIFRWSLKQALDINLEQLHPPPPASAGSQESGKTSPTLSHESLWARLAHFEEKESSSKLHVWNWKSNSKADTQDSWQSLAYKLAITMDMQNDSTSFLI